MKILFSLVLSIFLCSADMFGQAVFQSSGTGTGNWDDPASWTYISGMTTANYPVSGDTATITGTQTITVDVNSQCNQLTMIGASHLNLNSTSGILTVSNGMTVTGASLINLNLGVLTVTGNVTVNSASTITINQGALTIVGLLALTAPGSAGNTLIDVENGAFSCLGGMTITGSLGAGKSAELRIFNGAVNIAGGLATLTANAHIDFTGVGTMTLAGLISISNPASFVAGTGRVIYFGIPGSNQTIAPLTYYRLVITGVGTGIKQINNAVVVTDSLTLLTDTLAINAGGTLTLSNGITIVRTGGLLENPPIFAGTANLVYNDIARDTTGPEMPVGAGILQNLTISDLSGIKLGSNVTVNNNLTLQFGPLLTDVFSLLLTNPSGGSGNDPGITRVNGFIVGQLTRTIGATTGLRIFPLGIDNSGYREFDIEYTTAPSAAGTLTVSAFNTAALLQSGLPLIDNGVIVTHTAPLYWQADAAGGLSGGSYTVTLTGGGTPGVTDVTRLRVVKRPSTGGAWILDGTDGLHAGTNAVPVVGRTGMSGFSQFSFGTDDNETLPVAILSFSGTTADDQVILNWITASEQDNILFTIEHGTDGQHFSAIGSVPGAGTTDLKQSYTFTQGSVPPGANFYRLKQTDMDGQFTYSSMLAFSIAGQKGLTLYPNPATSYIVIGGNGSFRLLDAFGRWLQPLSAGSTDISSLPKGLYYVRWQGGLFPFLKN